MSQKNVPMRPRAATNKKTRISFDSFLKISKRASGFYWKCVCMCSMWYKTRSLVINASCLLNKPDVFVAGLNNPTHAIAAVST